MTTSKQSTEATAVTNSILPSLLWQVLAAPGRVTPISQSKATEPTTVMLEASTKAEVDRQVARLNAVRDLDWGWAGPGSSPPDKKSLDAAVEMIRRIGQLPLPVPMASVSSDGNAGLYWSDTKLYADLEMLSDGRVGYLLQLNGREPVDAEEELPDWGLPPTIAVALASAYLSNER